MPKILRALETLPQSLDTTYDRILEKIGSSNQSKASIAKGVLSWIFFTLTPCTPETIIQSLAVGPGSGETPPDMDQLELGLQDILDACHNFIVYDEKLDTVRFAHFSIQEYLRRHPDFGTEIGHKRMAETCLKSFTYKYNTVVERLHLLYNLRKYSIFH